MRENHDPIKYTYGYTVLLFSLSHQPNLSRLLACLTLTGIGAGSSPGTRRSASSRFRQLSSCRWVRRKGQQLSRLIGIDRAVIICSIQSDGFIILEKTSPGRHHQCALHHAFDFALTRRSFCRCRQPVMPRTYQINLWSTTSLEETVRSTGTQSWFSALPDTPDSRRRQLCMVRRLPF